MPLHTIRQSDEFTEMLLGVEDKVKPEVMEMHSSDDDDRHYVFVFWLNDQDDATDVHLRIRRNLAQQEEEDEWSYRIINFGGLIVVEGEL